MVDAHQVQDRGVQIVHVDGLRHGLEAEIVRGAVGDAALHAAPDRLAAHRTLGAAPREEFAWLVTHGSQQHLAAGDVLSTKGVPVEGLFVVLSGRIALFVDRGAGPQKAIEGRAGDVSGLLPPAAAIERGAALLADRLEEAERAARVLGAARLTVHEYLALT